MPRSKHLLAAASLFIAAASATVVGAAAQARDGSRLLSRADLNGDGQITRQEFLAARAQLFTRVDRNGDGYLSAEDAPRVGRRKAEERIRSAMQSLDTSRDGRVSRDEFVDGPLRLFTVADADGDGVIDENELAALRARASSLRE